jgi:hypothetical protein
MNPETLHQMIDDAMRVGRERQCDLAVEINKTLRLFAKGGVPMEKYRGVWTRLFTDLLGHTQGSETETIDVWCDRRFTEKFILEQE